MEQQPSPIGGAPNAPQRTQGYSSPTMQQQPTAMGGTSNATHGLHDHSSAIAQDQPTPIGTSKTHPMHPSATTGKLGYRNANLQGHVFSRMHRFSGLPPDLQEDTKQFEAFVERHQQVVFGNIKHALVKTVYGVKGKQLVDAIIQWLEARDAQQPAQGRGMIPPTVTMTTAGGESIHPGGATSATQNTPGQNAAATGATSTVQSGSTQQSPNVLPGTEVSQGSSGTQTTGLTGNHEGKSHGLPGNYGDTHGGLTGDHTQHGLTGIDEVPHGHSGSHATTQGSTGTHVPHVGSSATHGTTHDPAAKHGHHMPLSHGTTHGELSSSTNLHRAREIAEALVLSGFITPYKDDEKHSTHLKHYVTDHELFVPVGKNVTELHTTSVWSVVDGATYAVSLKRKAGLKGVIADGKDVYVVFNDHNNMAYLFESDVARDVIDTVHGETVNVQFESDHFPFGVLVESSLGDEKMKPQLFNAESKRVQEGFVNAWLSIGAQYRENSIKRIVEADSSKGGVVGSGVAGKSANANANADPMTTTGQQEVRAADVAAVGTGAGAGAGIGSGAMNQSNTSANANNNNYGIGANDGGMATTKHRDHHSATKDALYDAAAGAPLAHHDRRSALREGQSNEAAYGNTTYPPNHQDHHFASQQDPSNETPYGGAGVGTQSEHQHDHHLGRRDDPTYNEASYGGAAPSKRQDQNFGAQEDPSIAAPYGGAAGTESRHHHLGSHHQDPASDASYGEGATMGSKHHHHLGEQQEDPSSARHMADLAAAKIAGIEPTNSQYSSNTSAN
jgi:hypothetical protein